MNGNASVFQYGHATPTPVQTVGVPVSHLNEGSLPHTGFDVFWIVFLGVVLVTVGLILLRGLRSN